MDFKEKIKLTGLKKQKIAERLGITKEHLSRVINGKSPMTIELEDKLKVMFK